MHLLSSAGAVQGSQRLASAVTCDNVAALEHDSPRTIPRSARRDTERSGHLPVRRTLGTRTAHRGNVQIPTLRGHVTTFCF